VLVHGGLTAVASREARRDAARRRCRAWELAVGGANEGGHSGDPYWLHKRAIEEWRWVGGEVELAAAVKHRMDEVVVLFIGPEGWRRGGEVVGR
jgi:hypothetical protein